MRGAALDELVLRILQHGLLDGAGNRFDPSIVRIGVNVHHSVKQVSLESQLEQKLGTTDRVRLNATHRKTVTDRHLLIVGAVASQARKQPCMHAEPAMHMLACKHMRTWAVALAPLSLFICKWLRARICTAVSTCMQAV